MKNKRVLSEYRNGTWYTETAEDKPRLKTSIYPDLLMRMAAGQTASQTVNPSYSHTELNKLRLERMDHNKDRKIAIWVTCTLGGLVGISLAFNYYFYKVITGAW
jgi:hypothetical protein